MAEATSPSAPPDTAHLTSSFTVSSATETDTSKSQKRHANTISDYDFFAPAASSFQPRPYAPNSHLSDSRIKPFQFTRSQGRSHDALAVPPGMDPHPSDPNVIFVHPPFTTFPGSDKHHEGLNFQIMADNAEWFLDAKDFIHENNPNTHAIPYPPVLEPPRGWCPAKKKDLKERGTEGWTKGEEPRLRCTFCRRHYAGVNAKSMWRRHVFEKHKIAMANRRDGADRPRGRSSNKENKQIVRIREDGHETLVNLKLDNTPGTEPQNISHKSKFRSNIMTESSADNLKCQDKDAGSTLLLSPEPAASISNRQTSTAPSTSPPLTPHSSSDILNVSTESSGGAPPTPPSSTPLIPPSPYDPLLTPSFRHSPPRLPSDQPWRFPSPSHPLHSHTRELSLSMLVCNGASPLVKGSPVLGGSPLSYPPSSSSSSSKFIRPETPLSGIRLSLSSTNQTRFGKSRIGGSPLANRADLGRSRHRIEESPLSRSVSRPNKRSYSELTDDWLSGASLLSNQLKDPFNTMFASGGAERSSPIKRILEAESPILRNRNSAESKGLGIGLLEPFNLTRKPTSDDEGDLNDALDSSSNFGDFKDLDDDDQPPGNPSTNTEPSRSPSPPPKKRRLSVNE